MKKLDRYLLKSFFGPFLLTFLLVLFILAMDFLWLYIDELVGKGLSFGVIMEFMMWGCMTLIPQTLPLATLLASIMALGNLGENNELLAMKASGISLPRILTPLSFVAVGICIGAFFISNDLIPVSYKKIYALREDISRTKEQVKIPTGTFYDGIEGYILRVDRRNDDEGMMYGLMVYDHSKNNGNASITLAESGSIDFTEDRQNIIFTLYNGRSYTEENKMSRRDTTLNQNIVEFEQQTLLVPLEDYSFSRSDDERFGDEIMAKKLGALQHDRDSLLVDYAAARPKSVDRFLYGARLNYIRQIDTTRQRTPLAPFNLDTLMSTLTPDKEVTFINDLTSKLEEPISNLTTFERETYRYEDPIRKMQIESFRKFTLSIACLIFFFIGAPLGAIIRKGGLGTPVIISIFFFVFYYVIDMSGKKLARDGEVTPFVGTFISTAALLPIGIWLTIKSTQDSAIFNIDAIKLFFKRAWSSIKVLWKKIKRRKKMKIVYMGTPEFAVAPLEALLSTDFEISAVVTVPDKPSGRGLKVNESAVKKFAVEHNLPVLQPVSLKDPEFLAQLSSIGADMFIVVAFRMLPKEVWKMPRLGTFNLHASLLPQYRGAAPINWALINGERQTGVTTFLIDEQIDTGLLLFTEGYQIEQYDNAGTLHDTLMKMGAALVVKTAEALADGTAKPYPQTAFSELHDAPKLTKETCRIDFSWNATEVNNLIRGLSPYPAAFATLEDAEGVQTTVKIFEAYVCRDDAPAAPGTIFTDGKSYLGVACGEHSLRILDLQMAGKKRLEIKEFLKGFREPESHRFV